MSIYKIEDFLKFYKKYLINKTPVDKRPQAINQILKDTDVDYYDSVQLSKVVEDYRKAEQALMNIVDKSFEKDLITNTRRGYRPTYFQHEMSFVITEEEYYEGYVDILQSRLEEKLLEEAKSIKHIETEINNKDIVEYMKLHDKNYCHIRFVYDVELKKDKLYNL